MTEKEVFLEAFSQMRQPVIVTEKDIVTFMNESAVVLLKSCCTGRRIAAVLPPHITGVQAERFVGTAKIGTKYCTVSVSSYRNIKIYVVTPDGDLDEDQIQILSRLRASLTDIRLAAGCISAIADKRNDKELDKFTGSINKSYYMMKRCIDNSGTLAMLKSGTVPFFPENLDAAKLCSDVVESVAFWVHSRGITLRLNADKEINFVADRALLELLLINLLSNSLAACSDGGSITVTLFRSGHNLVLGVTDNGCGISPVRMSTVMDCYNNSRSLDAPDNCGMGLAIVRGIAELHKGTVIIESRESIGTSVRVMLSGEIQPSGFFKEEDQWECETPEIRLLTALSYVLPDECFI